LNTSDGKRLWVKTYDFKAYHHHEYNTSASSTPAVDADGVYITWATPDAVMVLAFDHDGKELWKQDIGKLAIQHGAGMSPIVIGDIVILGVYQEEEGPEGFLIGLNRKTGEKVWKVPRNRSGSAAYSTPALYTPKDGPAQLIFTSTSNGMTSLNPKTGAINWEMPGLFTLRCNASPVIYGDLIFATAGVGGGEKQAFAVQPGSKEKHTEPKVEYKLPRGPSNVPTPIVVGDLIFAWGDGGIVTCLKAATGEQVWMDRVGGNFFGSPVCINGRLYAIDSKGTVVVIEGSNQFKLLGKSDLGESSNSTPAVAGGVLYLRTISHLISVGGKKHTTL
jgi:outer membrane protein assembly factor BamB